MREDIRRAVGNCASCLLVKGGKPISKGIEHSRKPTAPWDTVAIDLMGPYPRTSRGKRFVLVTTDVMSRWVEAFPVSSSEINSIAPLLENDVFMRWENPRVILSDNAPQFRGKTWRDRCKAWGALDYTTPAYQPQANPTERRNQELIKGLRLKIAGGRQRDWDAHLPSILFALRRRTNRMTGQSPSQMLLGRTLPRPGEWNFTYDEKTQDRVESARQRHAALSSAEKPTDSKPLQVGELVLARNFALSNAAEGFNAQLAPRWTGPFTVRQRCGEDIYILERPGRDDIKLHVSALKRVPLTTPAEAVDAAQQSPDDISMDNVPEPRRQHESPTDSRPASAGPPTRGQSPALAAASADRPIRAQVDATPPAVVCSKYGELGRNTSRGRSTNRSAERARFPGLRRARSTFARPRPSL